MSEMKAVVDAVALLRDENLFWSTDMQDIRLELATLLEVSANNDVTKYLAEWMGNPVSLLIS